MNPLRWTSGPPEKICTNLIQRKGKDARRGIEVKYSGGAMGDGEEAFASARAAAAWITAKTPGWEQQEPRAL